MGAVERFERQLRERLEAAPDSQRPVILREAVDLAKPLIASKQITRLRAIATIHSIAQLHGVKTLKPASSAGFFRNLPSDDDGPRAA